MNYFVNMRKYVIRGMLSESDLDLIQKVIEGVIDRGIKLGPLGSKSGTFALLGQKRGERAHEIMRFNLWGDRDCALVENGFFYANTSDRTVEVTIDELLSYPSSKLSCRYEPGPKDFGQLASGFFYYNYSDKIDATAMVINTTFGRFLACIAAYPTLWESILSGVMLALQKQSLHDKIMEESVKQILCHQNPKITKEISTIVDYCTEIHEADSADSGRVLFFE